jgi:hypothetical protein
MFASLRAIGRRDAPHDVRSNPEARSAGLEGWIASSQGLLAMTAGGKFQNLAYSIPKISHSALRHSEFAVASRSPFKEK